MSSWLYAAPLHAAGAYEWVTSPEVTAHRVPAQAPEPRPFPSLREVVAAFRAAGCHGDSWFRTNGDPATVLPPCPGLKCRTNDLGEVSPTRKTGGDNDVWLPDTPVESVGFRKPSGYAVLRAVCALTPATGPLLVADEDGEVFIVSPGDQPEALEPDWPWRW